VAIGIGTARPLLNATGLLPTPWRKPRCKRLPRCLPLQGARSRRRRLRLEGGALGINLVADFERGCALVHFQLDALTTFELAAAVRVLDLVWGERGATTPIMRRRTSLHASSSIAKLVAGVTSALVMVRSGSVRTPRALQHLDANDQ
jgi:hypothetical protein